MATIVGSTNSSVWTFKLETTEGEYDIANNTSPLTVDIYIGRVSSSGSYMTGANISGEVACTGCDNLVFIYKNSGRLDIAAGKWHKIASVTFPAVPHNADGSKTVSVSASFNSNISPKSGKASGTVPLTTIPRQATLTSAPDFTDEENPTIYFNNPAGKAVTVQVCISFTGEKDDIKYYTLPDPTVTSYTFPLDEIIDGDTRTGHDILRAATTNGKTSRLVTFFVTTLIGNKYYYSTLQRTYTVINCAPELNPTIYDSLCDTNEYYYSLTNSTSKLIRYFNEPIITFRETAKKGASITNRSVTCGTQTKNRDGDYVNLKNVDSNVFTVSVTDNRGITVSKDISMEMIPYVKLTCNTEIDKKLGDDTTDSKILLRVNGDYYEGSFGAVNNSLTVEYRYKTNDTAFTDWIKTPSANVSNNKYSISTEIAGVDYTKTYTLQVRARDSIYTDDNCIYAKEQTVKMLPVFDWSETDFKFNVPMSGFLAFMNSIDILGTTKGPDGVMQSALAPCNDNNDLVLGYGGYDNGIGNTQIMGNNINLYSKNGITAHQPLHGKGGITYDIPIYHSDVDTMLTSGIYYMGTQATNKPGNGYNGYLEVFVPTGGGDYAYQTFIDYQGNQFQRWRNGGLWGLWIPIDYIVRSGTKDNWTFEQWASGKYECWRKSDTVTVTPSTQWGTLYAYDDAFPNQKYPFDFVEQPVLTVTPDTAGGNFWLFTGENGSNSQTPTLSVVRPTKLEVNAIAHYHAIGKWK